MMEGFPASHSIESCVCCTSRSRHELQPSGKAELASMKDCAAFTADALNDEQNLPTSCPIRMHQKLCKALCAVVEAGKDEPIHCIKHKGCTC